MKDLDLSYNFWHPLMHNLWICFHKSPIKDWGKNTKYIQKHTFASLKSSLGKKRGEKKSYKAHMSYKMCYILFAGLLKVCHLEGHFYVYKADQHEQLLHCEQNKVTTAFFRLDTITRLTILFYDVVLLGQILAELFHSRSIVISFT